MTVKKYAYPDAIQLTPHFNSSELHCKPDKKHNALMIKTTPLYFIYEDGERHDFNKKWQRDYCDL